MAHDLIIRGGTVVDGTGNAPQVADIAIDNGLISAVGALDGSADKLIDAADHIVTPGFVDLHTHLDAQVGWDPMMTPVSWHGVTTALLGNCGVTFAPCKPGDRELLAGMMETVEDIPREAILSGLPWNWESYGEYLQAVQSLNVAINVGGLIGHCALRYYVMGERGVAEQASAKERAEMAEIAAQAVRDGAAGFSTSRFLGHYLPDGRHVPGTHATHEELVEIAAAVGKAGGLMQNVLNLGGDLDGELELLRKQAMASGNRVLFSVTAGGSNSFGDRIAKAVNDMRAEGLDVSAVCIPRGSGLLSGLAGLPLWGGPTWKALRNAGFERRLEMAKDPQIVSELISEAQAKASRMNLDDTYYLGDGDRPNYLAGPDQSLQALANAADEHPAATWLRFAAESEGQALFAVRLFNRNMESLARLISEPFCMPGLGDAGAHVGQIMDSGWGTFVLSHWVRDQKLYTLQEAVRRISAEPARIMGLKNRGTIATGASADLNIIDLPNLGERMPRMVYDFPGGAARYIQRGVGYRATLCNGKTIVENDELTGVRAGKLA